MSAVFIRNQASTSGAALVARSGASPVLQSVRADGAVNGLLFELSVEQHYLNASDVNIEAVYTFPLPWGAVLLGMEFVLGEKVLQGKVIAKADAEEKYEGALEKGDTAIMLERAADGLYTVNLGNLFAHEKAIVRFRFAQLLSFEQGQVRIAVPTVIAPRYGDALGASVRRHQTPGHDLLADYPLQLNIVLAGAVAEGRMSSPSHALSVQHNHGKIEVSIAPSARLDRDFVLLVAGLAGKSICTTGNDADGLVVLASFCPEHEAPPPKTPLSIKILLDCSGSMNGDSIQSARRALHEVLKNLQPADRFTYSRFGDDVVHHSLSLMAATSRAVAEGAQWIAQSQADLGGTEIRKALLSTVALAQPFDADILLITDGEVWDTERLIASAEHAGQRIFAVGIGAAPASSLLHELAGKTGGACEFVGVNDDVAAAILRTFRRMRQAPVQDIEVQWGQRPLWQSKPGNAIFSGETVHTFAGFASHAPAHAVMKWSEGKDKIARQLSFQLDAVPTGGDTLARIAAATRRSGLAKDEQLALALQYQLVTESTNLLIVHARAESEKLDALPTLRMVPQMMAAGWSGVAHVQAANMKPPAMWRREPSAGGPLRVMESNGMETYDMPAFLRRQPNGSAPVFRMAQRSVDPYRYRAQLKRFLDQFMTSDGELDETIPYPMAFAEIASNIPSTTLDALRKLTDSGYLEGDVIRALIVTLYRCFYKEGIVRRWVRKLRVSRSRGKIGPQLERRVACIAKQAFDEGVAGPEFDIPAFLRKQAD